MTIDGIEASVKFAVLKPVVRVSRRGQGVVCQSLGVRLVPVQERRKFTPVLVWVLERGMLDLSLSVFLHIGCWLNGSCRKRCTQEEEFGMRVSRRTGMESNESVQDGESAFEVAWVCPGGS